MVITLSDEGPPEIHEGVRRVARALAAGRSEIPAVVGRIRNA